MSCEVYLPEYDVSRFPRYSDLAGQLRKLHDHLWSLWCLPELSIKPATLCMQVRDITDSFYNKATDVIYLYLVEYDMQDVADEEKRRNIGLAAPGRQRGVVWANVTTQLLHEMMHEFQYKVLKETTREGEELFRTTTARFGGSGHDTLFYSAIAIHAKQFGLTPEEFAREL